MNRLAEFRFSGLSEEISNHKTVYEIKTEIETKINSKEKEVQSGCLPVLTSRKFIEL